MSSKGERGRLWPILSQVKQTGPWPLDTVTVGFEGRLIEARGSIVGVRECPGQRGRMITVRRGIICGGISSASEQDGRPTAPE